jgi:hypothetical protein
MLCRGEVFRYSRRAAFRSKQAFAICAAALVLLPAAASLGESTASRKVTGELEVHDGVRVLRVWGTPYEQGYAHGYLLADNLVGFFEDVILHERVMPDPRMYETMVRGGLLRMMSFSVEERSELEGMLAGMTDKLGADGIMLKRLGRPLDVDDLKALNTIADWNPSACSSFAAWGPASADGEMVVARNLDYFDLPHVREQHLIIARCQKDPLRKRTASICWPGLIGAYTAMNEDGVFMAMHDAPAGKMTQGSNLIPRSLVIRHILETVQAEQATGQALRILRDSPAFRGNNFLLAAPFTGQAQPAVVFEYDGHEEKDGGVTMRTPQAAVNLTPPYTIACTNHYRLRSEAAQCNRYETIVERLKKLNPPSGKVDADAAFNIISGTAVTGTLHTAIALPNERVLIMRFASEGKNATENPPLRLDLAKLLEH